MFNPLLFRFMMQQRQQQMQQQQMQQQQAYSQQKTTTTTTTPKTTTTEMTTTTTTTTTTNATTPEPTEATTTKPLKKLLPDKDPQMGNILCRTDLQDALQPGMWKRLDKVPFPALPLPKCSTNTTNTSSYPTHQVEATLPLPHPWMQTCKIANDNAMTLTT